MYLPVVYIQKDLRTINTHPQGDPPHLTRFHFPHLWEATRFVSIKWLVIWLPTDLGLINSFLPCKWGFNDILMTLGRHQTTHFATFNLFKVPHVKTTIRNTWMFQSLEIGIPSRVVPPPLCHLHYETSYTGGGRVFRYISYINARVEEWAPPNGGRGWYSTWRD